MKKMLLILLCVFFVFSMSACEKGNGGVTSSDIIEDGPSVSSKSPSSTSHTDKGNTTDSSVKNTSSIVGSGSHTTSSSHTKGKASTTNKRYTKVESSTTSNRYTGGKSSTTKKSDMQDDAYEDISYEDIVCDTTANYKQVTFSVKNSRVRIRMSLPEQWELRKNNNGYNIVEESKTIGSIILSEERAPSSGLIDSAIAVGGMSVTHSIDEVGSDREPSYTRTLSYNFDDEHSNNKYLILTVNYQEIDSSAVGIMITEAQKSLSSIGEDWGLLPIEDNRNRILILGNSFVNSSKIGGILQTMCGSSASVEAQSRGNANVSTYVQDTNLMNSIRAGNYSVVFMCGFYTNNDALNLSKIVNACKTSNTKIAIFPAHNENRTHIRTATNMYPDVILVDWKAEVDALIAKGISYNSFCELDTYNHSKPLAGYVGAQMIYRAVFNKLPQTTSFSQVEKSNLNLLGKYVTTGSPKLIDESGYLVIG